MGVDFGLYAICHMFLEILKYRIENKKSCLGKTVLKMWSHNKNLCGPYHPQKIMDALWFLVFSCF